MFIDYKKTAEMINTGKLLHIAGTESLLSKLPRGNWIGGSTEYFMTEKGGKVSDELLFITEFPYNDFTIKTYNTQNIQNIAQDAYENGFSILIIPFDSEIHKQYAQNAAEYESMFLKNIVGWISGFNLAKTKQKPIVINGQNSECFSDTAIALHIKTPAAKNVNIQIVNIFEQDKNTPIIEFETEGFTVTDCIINGEKTKFADFLKEKSVDTKLPLIGDYSGAGINISFKSIENGVVNLYAPVFKGIKYRIAKPIPDYTGLFSKYVSEHKGMKFVFACNCILNFIYGELENKTLENFSGPITFGEIAYQLVNQTLVYVSVE
jgi:hypothetical protein